MKAYKNLEILNGVKSVCIIGHIDPDADALSSMVTLKDFLENHFNIKHVDLFAESESLPEIFEEILENETLNSTIKKYNTAIMLDSPNVERLGIYKNVFISAKQKIVIDHHDTNSYCGDINIVEPCSSTCEIIYSILKFFKYPITTKNQGKIYSGIITDTNNFTVGKFNKRTFKIASELISNIDAGKIYNHFLATTTQRQMQLLSLAIQNLTSLKHGQILISHITANELNQFKASSEDCSIIINKLATIANCKMVCFTYPKANSYYVSMRAKEGFDVSTIAKENEGGGHVGAAAFLTNKKLFEVEEYIIKEFSKQLDNKHNQKKQIFK